MDDGKANWDKWGNSWWPTVYLIDKEGYVRYWWNGELKWEQNNGHLIMRKRIQELIAES